MAREGIGAAVGDLNDGLKALMNSMGSASHLIEGNAQAAANANVAYQNLGKSFNVFDKSVRDNWRSLAESITYLKKARADADAHSKRIKVLDMATQGWTSTIKMLGTSFMDTNRKIVAGIGEMSSNLTKGASSFKSLKDALLAFNRASFEMSRNAQMMGDSGVFKDGFWDNLNTKTSLSKQQFMDMSNVLFRMNEVSNISSKELANMAEIVQNRLGPSWDVTKEAMERIVKLDNNLPGIRNHIDDMAKANELNNSALGDTLMLMRQQGREMKDLMTVTAYVTPLDGDGQQKQLLEFEKAATKRNQAIENLNTNTAQNAQRALISIEKIMTKLTTLVDKFLKKFSFISKAFVYMQSIGALAFGGISAAITALISQIQVLQASAIKAGGAIQGMGKGGLGGGIGMGIGMAAVSYGAMEMYGNVQSARGAGALDSSSSIKDRYEAERNKHVGMAGTVGGAIGAGIGGAIGTLGGPTGTLVGLGVGAKLGSGIGKSMAKSSSSDTAELARYEKAQQAMADKELNVEGIFSKDSDVISAIGSQEGDTNKRAAIQALAKSEAFGDNAQKSYKALAKMAAASGDARIAKLVEEGRQVDMLFAKEQDRVNSELATVKALSQQVARVKQLQDVYGAIAKMSSGMGETAAGSWAGSQAAAFYKESIDAEKLLLDKMGATRKNMVELLSSKSTASGMAAASAAPSEYLKLEGGKKVDMDGKDVAKINDAHRERLRLNRELESIPTTDKERIEKQKLLISAEKSRYDKAVDNLDISEKQKKTLKDQGDAWTNTFRQISRASRKLAEMAVRQEELARTSKLVQTMAAAATAEQDAKVNVLESELQLQRAQASVAEKSVAGYAVSYAHQKKIYDNLQDQRREQQKSYDILMKSGAAFARGTRESEAGLKRAGVTSKELSDIEKNRAVIMAKLNAAAAKANDDGSKNQIAAAQRSVGEALQKQISAHTKIVQLQEQELDMAMHLREGYLDVINEMTTGRGLVAELLPDANRGIMALQELGMRTKGDDFGGAMKRGFVSINPFQDAGDLSKAPKFTKRGFQAPQENKVISEYNERIARMFEGSRRTGGGQFAGQQGLGQSAAFAGGGVGPAGPIDTATTNAHEAHIKSAGKTIVSGSTVEVIVNGNRNLPPQPSAPGGRGTVTGPPIGLPGKAAGGILAGSPSNRDNMLGMIDGKELVGLASGEYVVNAKSTQKYGALLDAINSSGRGFSGGGRIYEAGVIWGGKSYENKSYNEIHSAVARGEPGSYQAMLAYLHDKRGLSKGAAEKRLSRMLESRRNIDANTAYAKSFAEEGIGMLGFVGTMFKSPFEYASSRSTAKRDSSRDLVRKKEVARKKYVSEQKSMIRREMAVRGMSGKLSGQKSLSAMQTTYDNFMSGQGAREDRMIADPDEALSIVNSFGKDNRNEIYGISLGSLLSGASKKDARRKALYAATRKEEFHGIKKARANMEGFMDKGLMEKVNEGIKKSKSDDIKAKVNAGWSVFKGNEQKSIYTNGGLASGGSVGSSLAAMMSGTVSIGSLNVNGQALARNLSGVNDMSLAMQQAHRNHHS